MISLHKQIVWINNELFFLKDKYSVSTKLIHTLVECVWNENLINMIVISLTTCCSQDWYKVQYQFAILEIDTSKKIYRVLHWRTPHKKSHAYCNKAFKHRLPLSFVVHKNVFIFLYRRNPASIDNDNYHTIYFNLWNCLNLKLNHSKITAFSWTKTSYSINQLHKHAKKNFFLLFNRK